MSKKEVLKRYIVFVIGLFFIALGVAFTKKSMLGVSPISSVPNILSIRFTQMTLGTWLIIWNCVLIVGQIAVLGKGFKLIQLLQIPLSFVFGYFTDFGMWMLSFCQADTYVSQILFTVVGVIILGVGVALTVIADVIMNSGEAIVKAIADRARKNFGNVKIAFDIGSVALAIILSLVFFGKVVGAREGTVINAVFTGIVVKIVDKYTRKPLERLMTK